MIFTLTLKSELGDGSLEAAIKVVTAKRTMTVEVRKLARNLTSILVGYGD